MDKDLLTDRCFAEINLSNLEHNIKEIKKYIPKKTKIMAILKANAYGHDLVIIAKKLMKIGVTDFAVATLEEGITLRNNGIKGNILLLGYTNPQNLKYVIKYDLIQTVVDEEYAKKLIDLNLKIKVHIKINTGMNRIGISYQNIDFIKSLYQNSKLEILGIFTHLCVSNSNKKSDIAFSYKQIERFDSVIKALKDANIEVIGTHVQGSYGILNYPELNYDYVRTGIIMYGLYNDTITFSKINMNLKPVMTLKGRIVSVNELEPGETVGYGRSYKVKKREKIATVAIGYVDGIPKNLSCSNAKVLVNNKEAYIVGKICMDSLTINVTGIKNIKEGDLVTFFGEQDNIRCEYLATILKTITPELLGRLGSRIGYIEKN